MTGQKNDTQKNVPDETEYFYFDMSEKKHPVTLPAEEETAWEKLKDIKWDPARGD